MLARPEQYEPGANGRLVAVARGFADAREETAAAVCVADVPRRDCAPVHERVPERDVPRLQCVQLAVEGLAAALESRLLDHRLPAQSERLCQEKNECRISQIEGGLSMSKKIVLMSGATLVSAVFALTAYAAGGPIMGPVGSISRPAFHGYYDGHKDTYLNTDVSSKADAAAMHINYSAKIGTVKGLPEIYLVQGRAASGQLAIFGSEPGEKDYSPLWAETILTWKAGAKPVLITSDTQIDKIEKAGTLTERDAHVVLNCPIIKVGT